jgi:hypothetical protein
MSEIHEAVHDIQTPALVALANDNEGLSIEALSDLQRRTLNGIVAVTVKALAKTQ